MSFEAQGTKLFGGVCRDIPGVPEKFEEKIVFNSRPLVKPHSLPSFFLLPVRGQNPDSHMGRLGSISDLFVASWHRNHGFLFSGR